MIEKTKKYSTLDAKDKILQIAGWLVEKKAKEPVVLDLRGKDLFAEGMIIVSATSVRHAQGLADHVISLAKQEKFEFLHLEGFETGQWVLLDLNDVVVNIFQGTVRELYNLEGLWSDMPRLEPGELSSFAKVVGSSAVKGPDDAA